MRLVVGCNCHWVWQNHKAMRFVLLELKGKRAKLGTRTTHKKFWVNVDDLIFIKSKHNRAKADKLELKELLG